MKGSFLSVVGIIANPSAGKDIRRLVSESRFVSNQEKINIIRRVISALIKMDIEHILLMPDYGNLTREAIKDIDKTDIFEFISIPVFNSEQDTTKAARIMEEKGAGAIVTLGGDGTNRATVLGTSMVPIMPISTGTNNAFPVTIEGTLAGICAASVAKGQVDIEICAPLCRKLSVSVDGALLDVALVDVAVSNKRFVGSRAIWDTSSVSDLYLAKASPETIGLSSIGGFLNPLLNSDDFGLHVELAGKPTQQVLAPVIPGKLERIGISSFEKMPFQQPFTVSGKQCTLALDGERAIPLKEDQVATICVSRDGPPVIDSYKTLLAAAEGGIFIRDIL